MGPAAHVDSLDSQYNTLVTNKCITSMIRICEGNYTKYITKYMLCDTNIRICLSII